MLTRSWYHSHSRYSRFRFTIYRLKSIVWALFYVTFFFFFFFFHLRVIIFARNQPTPLCLFDVTTSKHMLWKWIRICPTVSPFSRSRKQESERGVWREGRKKIAIEIQAPGLRTRGILWHLFLGWHSIFRLETSSCPNRTPPPCTHRMEHDIPIYLLPFPFSLQPMQPAAPWVLPAYIYKQTTTVAVWPCPRDRHPPGGVSRKYALDARGCASK